MTNKSTRLKILRQISKNRITSETIELNNFRIYNIGIYANVILYDNIIHIPDIYDRFCSYW